MDTALYEGGRQLLEARLAEHSKAGRLEKMRSSEEADIGEILRRDTPAEKQRQRRNPAAKPSAAKSDMASQAEQQAGGSCKLHP